MRNETPLQIGMKALPRTGFVFDFLSLLAGRHYILWLANQLAQTGVGDAKDQRRFYGFFT